MTRAMDTLTPLKNRVLDGGELTFDEAVSLADTPDVNALCDAAEEITRRFTSDSRFDSCSIVNIRSGACPEDCKWCAQSRHASTGCEVYAMLGDDETLRHARASRDAGIGRFSLVASGRRVTGAAIDRMCSVVRRIYDEVPGLSVCASLGLIGPEELKKLHDAGVRRYHCNLEAGPSHFATLCSTHTVDDKLATIDAARNAGLEVCSGGIIGMGETRRQRVELAWELRRARPVSIPLNLLIPIPGTPLQDMEPLAEEEILRCLAVIRFLHPSARIRFAGGRTQISRDTQLRAMRMAVNGAIMGDMLTTVGSTVEDDKKTIREAGYDY